MVERVWRLLTKEWSSLHEAALLLGCSSFASQLLALFRDRELAASFGASHMLDIYYAAFRVPDFIFVSVASLVSLSVLIPFLLERIDRDPASTRQFIDNVFSFFFLIIALTSLLAFWLAPWLMRWLFPVFARDALFPELVTMTRILLLSPIFLGLSNFLASITQIYQRFFLYALSPVLYNLGIIVGVIFLYPLFGLTGLAWGVVLGAALHLGIQVPFVWSKSLLPRPIWRIDYASIKQIVFLSLPRTITLSANEIAELSLISLASLFASGSISIFSLSFNLQSVPLSIIGVSYSLAAFPLLTRLFSAGQREKFLDQMIVSARHIIFWTLPVIILFIVVRAQIVRVILGAGHFDWSDTRLTAAALALFAVSLIPQSLSMLFVRSAYARGQTLRPLLINGASALFIIASAYGLIKVFAWSATFRYFVATLLRVDRLEGAVMLMLPLAFSLGATLGLFAHWLSFQHDFPSFSKPVLKTLYQSLLASIIMGFISYTALNFLANIFNLNTTLGIFSQGALAGLLGMIIWVAVLRSADNHEIVELGKALHHKFWQARAIAPEPEGL